MISLDANGGEAAARASAVKPSFGSFVVIAENIRSLHNVGAIFRTADGAGVSWLFLAGYSGFPPRPQIAKVALGAETWLPWQHVWHPLPLLDRLEGEGYQLVTLEKTGEATPLPTFRPRWPLALIVGNEVEGVSAALLRRAHATVAIPMYGQKASLNVAIAFGIAAFRLAEQGLPHGARPALPTSPAWLTT